jgi:hypothetical protein
MNFSGLIAPVQSRGASVYRHVRQHWLDILLAVTLALTVGIASYQGAQRIDPVIFDGQTMNVWFQGDTPRIFANITDRASNQYRTTVHPLFPLIAFPPVYVVKTVLGVEAQVAVRIVIATVASLWLGTLFVLLRLMNCHRFDAILLSVLAASSAAAVFWFVVPETVPFGSLSILLALCLVAIAQHRKLSPLWYILVSAATLSTTVTNSMVGMLATVVNYSWKRASQITIAALLLVILLWGVEKLIFRSTLFFLISHTGSFVWLEERKNALLPERGSVFNCIQSFIFHSMVMPAIKGVNNVLQPDWPIMSTQHSLPGSASVWGAVAVGLWAALLGLGLWALFSVRIHLKLRLVLGFALLGQLALHAVYGDETFLHSLHFLPLLVVLAAFSTLTRMRPFTLALASLLILCAGINNSLQFNQATEHIKLYNGAPPGTPRHEVRLQMQQRPTEPWPRGTGHVVLAVAGSREEDKAYHEPGGSFSPTVGSFGVSIWNVDSSGNVKTTSDTIPLSAIRQQLIWSENQNIPGILTQTNSYKALWSSTGLGRWTLNLQTQTTPGTKPVVVIRSVGPAGGAIHSLEWNSQQLFINKRWSVKIGSGLAQVYLGEEGQKGWMKERSPRTQWQSKNGWGYARFELADGNEWNVQIEDSAVSKPNIELNVAQMRSPIDLNLPDPQFTTSLNAQVAHLLMGLVGRETRPGEPTNYPLSWQRDGAYTIVALARAGQVQVAKELSTYFAEHDFFGGFGSEADAPGLSIWALETVAEQLNQPDYDQWLWPHVQRKAEFILKMMATDQPIHQPKTGPVVPHMEKDPNLTLVAEPARDGLIIGRMDNQRPLLFVNAVSYRGLLDAASLAERVNQPTDAQRWRTKATQLKLAWEKAFKPPESNNDRTYISSLWHTWTAASRKDTLLKNLEARWTKQRDPRGGFRSTSLWTYFDLAEAHQWLFLDRSDRAWQTLSWFWEHQASPGLYTWWEGKGEENTFRRWEAVRGWVYPPHVTPHYWTAAEMLLLQLDMLAYLDKAASEPTAVIGAGIPKTWLKQPMSVKNLPISKSRVDWNWDGQQMRVKVSGERVKVRLGSVFPPGTSLYVEYSA